MDDPMLHQERKSAPWEHARDCLLGIIQTLPVPLLLRVAPNIDASLARWNTYPNEPMLREATTSLYRSAWLMFATNSVHVVRRLGALVGSQVLKCCSKKLQDRVRSSRHTVPLPHEARLNQAGMTLRIIMLTTLFFRGQQEQAAQIQAACSEMDVSCDTHMQWGIQSITQFRNTTPHNGSQHPEDGHASRPQLPWESGYLWLSATATTALMYNRLLVANGWFHISQKLIDLVCTFYRIVCPAQPVVEPELSPLLPVYQEVTTPKAKKQSRRFALSLFTLLSASLMRVFYLTKSNAYAHAARNFIVTIKQQTVVLRNLAPAHDTTKPPLTVNIEPKYDVLYTALAAPFGKLFMPKGGMAAFHCDGAYPFNASTCEKVINKALQADPALKTNIAQSVQQAALSNVSTAEIEQAWTLALQWISTNAGALFLGFGVYRFIFSKITQDQVKRDLQNTIKNRWPQRTLSTLTMIYFAGFILSTFSMCNPECTPSTSYLYETMAQLLHRPLEHTTCEQKKLNDITAICASTYTFILAVSLISIGPIQMFFLGRYLQGNKNDETQEMNEASHNQGVFYAPARPGASRR